MATSMSVLEEEMEKRRKMTKKERIEYHRPKGAVKWFSWRPVQLGLDGRWVWLELVWKLPDRYHGIIG